MNIRFPQPWPHQQRILDSRARNKLLVCGRRAGKTQLAIIDLVCRAITKRGEYWIVTPDLVQARVSESFLRDALQEVSQELQQQKLWRLPNGSVISIRTAESPRNLRGAGLSHVFVDEAAHIKGEIFYECLMPALKDKRGTCLLASTPNGRNWYYELYQKVLADKQWGTFKFPSWASPLIDRAELELERAIMGEARWNQEYGGEFVQKGAALFAPYWFDNIMVSQLPTRFDRGIVSVDLSLGELDSDYQCVCFFGHRAGINYADCHLDRMSLDKLVKLVRRVYDEYKPRGCEGICIDATGMQALAGHALLKEWQIAPPLWEIKQTVKKETRISRLSTLLARESLKLLNTAGGRLCLGQLQDFPVGEWDDGPDAIEQGWHCLTEI